jgi:pantoate--beta-alanine ligase
MKVIKTLKRLRNEIRRARQEGLLIGFVPTMGTLHQGHLSLMQMARKETDLLVVSIFVNPLQFGPKEDFKQYPRNPKQDAKLCKDVGVDIVFAPADEEVYSSGFDTYVDMTKLTSKLCGKSRPGHFRGVMTVVTKLFNMVEPDIAYFGQKDYQQATIIKKMVKDLNMNLKVKVLPTIREIDGLAMSSRNQYLTTSERLNASRLYQALVKSKQIIISGNKNADKICHAIISELNKIPKSKIDYVEIVDADTLEPIQKIERQKVVIAVAIYLGKTRLIDNIKICI